MNVGDEYTLWRTEFKKDAYRDQFNIPHSGYVVVEELRVKVVEVKDVPGKWRQSDTHKGARAVSEDGREFFLNWSMFPDDSTTPCYYWDRGAEQWCDAVQACNYGIPHAKPDNTRALPAGAAVCDKHNYAFDIVRGECFRCKLDKLDKVL